MDEKRPPPYWLFSRSGVRDSSRPDRSWPPSTAAIRDHRRAGFGRLWLSGFTRVRWLLRVVFAVTIPPRSRLSAVCPPFCPPFPATQGGHGHPSARPFQICSDLCWAARFAFPPWSDLPSVWVWDASGGAWPDSGHCRLSPHPRTLTRKMGKIPLTRPLYSDVYLSKILFGAIL